MKVLAIYLMLMVFGSLAAGLVLERNGRFRQRESPSGSLSKIASFLERDDVGCTLRCISATFCSLFAFNKSSSLGSDNCALYSHDYYNGTLEDVTASNGQLLFEKYTIKNNVATSNINESFPQDCREYYERGYKKNAVYLIKPATASEVIAVYCDMEDGIGGWTVILKRFDGSVQFHDKTWNEYKNFFGNPEGEYWLGLENMHQMTDTDSHQSLLKVEIVGDNGVQKYAEFDSFTVQPESSKYQLFVKGHCPSSTLPDELTNEPHTMEFTTKDSDNDQWSSNCATARGGGFWWKSCGGVSLTGNYKPGVVDSNSNSYWRGLYASSSNAYRGFKSVVLKIRRFNVKSTAVTYEGTGDGAGCSFPFVYDGVTYTDKCTTSKEPAPWCRTTASDTGPWGYCPTELDCQDGYQRRGCLTDRACYKLSSTNVASHDAGQTACDADHSGAYLLALETTAEHDWFKARKATLSVGVSGLWMGGKKDGNNVWRWPQPDNQAFAITKWNSGQPDGSGPCQQFFGNPSLWDDIPCTTNLGFICEYHENP